MLNESFKEKVFNKLLDLSSSAKYQCRPNPAVAAVLVYREKIIGVGQTQPLGQSHAEIKALESVKDKSLLKDSELYVTLMPCNFHGRTPSCVEALERYKIKKIHVAFKDPNPLMQDSENFLLGKGIAVFYDFPETVKEKLFFINFDYFKRILTKIPFFLIKYVITLDGKMATYKGDSQWISSSYSRDDVHQQRACCDGILVGGRTFIKDDPSLDARIDRPCKQPLPIVALSGSFDFKRSFKLLQPHRKTVFLLKEEMDKFEETSDFIRSRGKVVISYNDRNHYTDPAFWQAISDRFELNSIYVEGGAFLQQSLSCSGLIDKVEVYIASVLLMDGVGGLSPFSGTKRVASIKDLQSISYTQHERFGEDIKISGYLKKEEVGEIFEKLS